jgi:hypothetical protein
VVLVVSFSLSKFPCKHCASSNSSKGWWKWLFEQPI